MTGAQIENYFTLKDAIEEMRPIARPEVTRFNPKGKQKVRGTIHMIIGTDTDLVYSNKKRWAHMRGIISLSVLKKPKHQEKWNVKFESDDEELIRDEEGNDLMVVSAMVAGFEVKRILVDNGSVVKVLSWEAYRKMVLEEQSSSKANQLYGFANHPIEVKGSITLLVTLGYDERTTRNMSNFT
ncbi:hypothetical protein J1N35_007671 [Gossypium stocksii]|uniref:Uncharacterized protein n=1 Tax=Gossypium stocksii TaxID=47602 RepID=A0A9D3W7W1_9ROSI|nr:hypothetical protein J1N35_007671 [Gossypium stocksii]